MAAYSAHAQWSIGRYQYQQPRASTPTRSKIVVYFSPSGIFIIKVVHGIIDLFYFCLQQPEDLEIWGTFISAVHPLANCVYSAL